MPRRLRQVVIGASPLVRPLAQPVGRSPNQGHSPQSKNLSNGEAQPRLTSGRQSRCVFLAN